jgi:hypothetical protein
MTTPRKKRMSKPVPWREAAISVTENRDSELKRLNKLETAHKELLEAAEIFFGGWVMHYEDCKCAMCSILRIVTRQLREQPKPLKSKTLIGKVEEAHQRTRGSKLQFDRQLRELKGRK